MNAHVAGRYIRLVPPGERARFSERVGAIRRVPLGRGWRILITPAVRR